MGRRQLMNPHPASKGKVAQMITGRDYWQRCLMSSSTIGKAAAFGSKSHQARLPLRAPQDRKIECDDLIARIQIYHLRLAIPIGSVKKIGENNWRNSWK